MRTPGPTRPGRGMTTLSQGQKEEIMPSNRTTRKPRGLTATPVPEADSADTGATVAASAADGDTVGGPRRSPRLHRGGAGGGGEDRPFDRFQGADRAGEGWARQPPPRRHRRGQAAP